MEEFAKACIGCNSCVRDCQFLTRNGNPKQIIAGVQEGNLDQGLCFDCSLCGLCASSCPKDLDPSRAFLAMRQQVYSQKGEVLDVHKGILAYEKRGISPRFSLYTLPRGCDTIFFPGCALSGTRSKRTRQLYDWLKTQVPALGLVLDCCAKPSHDLGREDFFKTHFSAMEDFLVKNGVQKVITACPNCLWVFNTHARQLTVASVYAILAQTGKVSSQTVSGEVTVHDPCTARFESDLHADVRQLIQSAGLGIQEMEHTRGNTLCCGEGGTVFRVSPDLAESWGEIRKKEANGKKIITYCAGCSEFLGRSMDTSHVLDLVFDPANTMKGKEQRTHSPFTYLSRLRLKKQVAAAAAEPQDLKPAPSFGLDKPGLTLTRVLVLLFIAAGIAGARMTGLDQLVSQDNIQNFVQDFGALAPMIFIFMVTLAPAFFLPGAPFIIAGGLIFGPVWGVVYGIIGATAGACLAFLVARYAASDWVESKITHPALIRLKDQTEHHGWKIVAFTRLIPLFPFNLLSYALGLTRIKFSTYFITSFICMLPGCVGYILLSSSIFDLLQGKFSPQFFAGAALVLLLALLPLLLKKHTALLNKRS